MKAIRFLVLASLLASAPLLSESDASTPAKAEDITIDFSEGKWDKSKWTPIRVLPIRPVEKLTDFEFIQQQDCISFDCSLEDKKRTDDNCVLVYDTGRNDAEFEVVFESGNGDPGILISPEFSDDGVLLRGYGVFVADHTIAAWYVEADPAKKTSTYYHLVRASRWQPKFQKHKIVCRYDKTGFAIKVNDSDTFVIHPKWEIGQTSVKGFKVNSKIGIWGCHGLSKFYSVTIRERGTLLFNAVDPNRTQ